LFFFFSPPLFSPAEGVAPLVPVDPPLHRLVCFSPPPGHTFVSKTPSLSPFFCRHPSLPPGIPFRLPQQKFFRGFFCRSSLDIRKTARSGLFPFSITSNVMLFFFFFSREAHTFAPSARGMTPLPFFPLFLPPFFFQSFPTRPRSLLNTFFSRKILFFSFFLSKRLNANPSGGLRVGIFPRDNSISFFFSPGSTLAKAGLSEISLRVRNGLFFFPFPWKGGSEKVFPGCFLFFFLFPDKRFSFPFFPLIDLAGRARFRALECSSLHPPVFFFAPEVFRECGPFFSLFFFYIEFE